MNQKLTQKKKQCLQIQSKGQDVLMLILVTKQKWKALLLRVDLGPPVAHEPDSYALDNREKSAKT